MNFDWSVITGYIIQGIFIAVGTVIGNYIAQRGLVNQLEKAIQKIRREKK